MTYYIVINVIYNNILYCGKCFFMTVVSKSMKIIVKLVINISFDEHNEQILMCSKLKGLNVTHAGE